MKIFLFIPVIFISGLARGQATEAEKNILAGNQFYRQQQYEQAIAEYAKALAIDPANTTAKFNHANALYKAGKQVEASKTLTELTTAVTEKQFRSKTYYNKGVILSTQKNLEESIEAYKNALRQEPADKEARENLQKALLELKKKIPPEKKQPDKKQDKNKQQQKQPQSKMNPREAEQRLRLLAQKEKEVQERLQKEKSTAGGGPGKDW